MKIDALKGDSLSHSALRARSYANVYFKTMNERALLVTATGATAPGIAPAIFNYFGAKVEIKEGMAPEAIADALLSIHGRRFLEYRKNLVRNAKVQVFEGTPGMNVLESAWEATQRAQTEVNQLLDQGQAEKVKRYCFEFNGEVVEFHPYAAGHEVAERAMNQFRAAQLERENSPEGQATKARREKRQAKAKANLDGYVQALPSVLTRALDDVLLWIERYSKAYNVNQRDAHVTKVLEAFQAEDFQAHAYVGEDAVPHVLSSKQTLGLYIVGQFMATLEVGREMPVALEVLLGQYHAQPE